MGKPDLMWRNSAGTVIQPAWSTQPASYVTFIVYFDNEGIVTKVDHFSWLHQFDWNYGYCSDSDGRQVCAVSFDDRSLKVTGGIATPDPLISLGGNEEAMCMPYMEQENAFVR